MSHSSISLNQPQVTMPLEGWYVRSVWLASTVMLSLWCASWLANTTASERRRDPWHPNDPYPSLRPVQDEQTQVSTTEEKEDHLSMTSIRDENKESPNETTSDTKGHQKVPSSSTTESSSNRREPATKSVNTNESLFKTYYKRFKDSQDMMRDLTQMITTSLLINTLTHEIESTTVIVSWIFVTCAVSSILSNNKGLPNGIVHKSVMIGCALSALIIVLRPWCKVFY